MVVVFQVQVLILLEMVDLVFNYLNLSVMMLWD